MSATYIVLLNYNGWQNTCECVRSLLFLLPMNTHILICDNNSTDKSVEYIRSWITGKISGCYIPEHLNYEDAYNKITLSYKCVKQDENKEEYTQENRSPITIIKNKKNIGFSAGNNAGIRYALKDETCKYLWILNNDTIVRKDTLQALIKKAETDKSIGIVGSIAYSYYQPDTIQKIGAGFDLSIMDTPILGAGIPVTELKNIDVSKCYTYCGTSFLLKRSFVETVGLMNERQFLYFEEGNYTERARRNGYEIAIAADSVFYHKESVSTKKQGSAFMHYHFMRSMMIFLRDFYPQEVRRLAVYHICRAIFQLMKFRFRWGMAILRGIMDGLRA